MERPDIEHWKAITAKLPETIWESSCLDGNIPAKFHVGKFKLNIPEEIEDEMRAVNATSYLISKAIAYTEHLTNQIDRGYMYVILVGDVVSGVTTVGPFETHEEALEYAGQYLFNDTWHIQLMPK